LRRFLYAENGAVSVYLILIIVPIFLFQAVLIDFARIKVAEKETESVINAATRAVMSSFDTELQKRGLYGMGLSQEESEKLFSDVFIKNMSGGVTSDAFHFINTKAVEGSMRVTPVYSLASHVIFEGQLLEDMKIKAPIEYTLEIADKFQKSGVREPFQLGSQFAKDAVELEKLIEQREGALDEAWQSTEVLYAKTTSFHSYYGTRIAELDDLAAHIGIHTIDEVRGEISQVNEELQSLSNTIRNMDLTLASLVQAGPEAASSIQTIVEAKRTLQEQASTLSQKINELEVLVQQIMKYTALVISTKLEVSTNESDVRQLQQLIEPTLRLAKQKNDEIRSKLTGISSSSINGAQGANDVFQNVSLIGDDYFYQYQTSVARIAALFSAFQSSVERVFLFTSEHTSEVNQANDTYWSAANDFHSKQSPIEKSRMDKNEATTMNKQTQKNKIQVVLDQAKQSIGGCTLPNSQSGDAAHYSKLQGESGLYQKYRQANAQDITIGNDVAYDLDKAEPASLSAMDILGAINHAAEVLRDELYVNEFALTKFNYRTYGLEKDPNGKQKLSNELVDPGTHALASQEVEYLLYGFSSCAANISSAYAEMFSLRLAIRTVEGLLDPKKELLNIGSPLLVLLAPAAQGAVEALVDMNALVKGDAVELSSKLSAAALKLTYKDYLRLFLMLHSNNAKLMSRMQALLELETGKDLIQVTSYIQANATSEIRLWFIPQVMKLLDGTGLLGCKVVGTQCQMNRTAVITY
jgi:predicted  nucleic acid-binding Zn-ribbon protein